MKVFQLRSVISILDGIYELRTFQLKSFQLFVFFSTTLSNYMYPNFCEYPSKVCVFGGFPPNEIYQPDQTVLYGTGKSR